VDGGAHGARHGLHPGVRCWQNRGTLSKNRREGEFRALLNDEVVLIEGIVRDAFEGFNDPGGQAPSA
jgi:hypothetical protein